MARNRIISKFLSLVLAGVFCSTATTPAFAQKKDLKIVPKVEWSSKLGRTANFGRGLYQFTEPLVEADRIYVGSAQGGIFALDRQGKQEWVFPTVGPVYAGIVSDGNLIYTADSKGYVYAIRTDGTEAWRVEVGREVMARPLIFGPALFVVSMWGELIAIDRQSGALQWRTTERLVLTEFAVKGASNPVELGGYIIVGYADGRLVAHRPQDGHVAWERRVAERSARLQDVDTTPLVKDGVIFTASLGGGLAAIKAKSGTTKWQREIASPNDLVVSGDTLYASGQGTVYAMKADTGKGIWRTPLPVAEISAPVVIDGKILTLSTDEGHLFVLDQASGELIGYSELSKGTYGRLATDGEYIYVVTNNAHLIALRFPE